MHFEYLLLVLNIIYLLVGLYNLIFNNDCLTTGLHISYKFNNQR